jgi:hypothetical protein
MIIDEKYINTLGIEKMGQEIVAYEREPLSIFNLEKDDDVSDFHVCEIRMVQTRKSYMLFSAQYQLGYSRIHIFKKSWTARQIRLRIYELLRPLIQKLPDTSRLTKRRGQLSQDQLLEYEHDYFFKDARGEYNIDNNLYDIEIHNNLPTD